MAKSRQWARVAAAVIAAALALGLCGVIGAGAARTATPSFPAPDCPATLKGGAATLTSSLLSDATHTMKRYENGGDTNGGEIGCQYYDAAVNNNFEWTLYYLFRSDTRAQVTDEINGGYGPIGGWAHPDPSYCGVSKTTYAFVSCNSTDADTVAGASAMLAAAESMAAPQLIAGTGTTSTTPAKPKAKSLAELVVPIESVSNGCGGGKWDTVVAAQNYIGNTSKYADSNFNPLAPSYEVNFKDACDLHDACYSGAVVRDTINSDSIVDFRNDSRSTCDTKFLANMRTLCSQQIPETERTALANCRSTGGSLSIGAKSRYNFVRCWGNLFYETAASASGANDAARVNDKVSIHSAYCDGLKYSK